MAVWNENKMNIIYLHNRICVIFYTKVFSKTKSRRAKKIKINKYTTDSYNDISLYTLEEHVYELFMEEMQFKIITI